jgi:hypothetical protein
MPVTKPMPCTKGKVIAGCVLPPTLRWAFTEKACRLSVVKVAVLDSLSTRYSSIEVATHLESSAADSMIDWRPIGLERMSVL